MPKLIAQASAALLLVSAATPASAWDRGETDIFAIVPNLPGDVPVSIEGLTVGPDGTVYTPSFGFNSKGEVLGPPHLFSFKPNGALLHDVALANTAPTPQPSPHLLGLVFQASSRTLPDLRSCPGHRPAGRSRHGQVERIHELRARIGLRAQRAHLRQCGQCLCVGFVSRRHLEDRRQWRDTDDVRRLADALAAGQPGVILIPPFGANGVEFNKKYTATYVANTAYHPIVKVPVTLNHDGSVSV